jgi:pilus assembly protein FimV
MLDIESEEVSINSEASIQRMSDVSGIDLASVNDSALELTIGDGMSYLSQQGISGVNEDDNEVIKAGAVDPLEEAEVYLAYDRDEQAIQVLKEAYVENPERGELAEKLLDIYHKQDDRRSFDVLVGELHRRRYSTQNLDWDKVVQMGRDVSPENPLFSDDSRLSELIAVDNNVLNLDENEAPITPTLLADPDVVDPNVIDLPDDLDIAATLSTDTALRDLKIDDLDLEISELADPLNEADAPILSKIISQNVESKPGFDIDDKTPQDGAASLNLGFDIDDIDIDKEGSQFKMLEEDAKHAVAESVEVVEPSAVEPDSAMSGMTEGTMSKLEPYHESETALELAKAYLELGEQEIAKGFIEEVLSDGSSKQKSKARNLIKELAT